MSILNIPVKYTSMFLYAILKDYTKDFRPLMYIVLVYSPSNVLYR